MDELSLWEFRAATGGYRKAKSTDEDGPTEAEIEALAAWLDEPAVWH